MRTNQRDLYRVARNLLPFRLPKQLICLFGYSHEVGPSFFVPFRPLPLNAWQPWRRPIGAKASVGLWWHRCRDFIYLKKCELVLARANLRYQYCLKRWQFTRTSADRLIAAAAVTGRLTPMGVIPSSERVVRPLTGLPPAQQRAALARCVACDTSNHEEK
jgi:hypothetical protein